MTTDSKKMQLISKVIAKMADYQKCVEGRCKIEVNAHKKATESHRNRLATLQNNLATKKITLDVFTKDVGKLRTQMLELEETKKRNECAIKKCKTELLKVLDVFVKSTQEECRLHKLPKVCDAHKEFKTFRAKLVRGTVRIADMKDLMAKFARV